MAHGAAYHLAVAFRVALSQGACGRPGCCGSALFLYDHIGGRKDLPPTRTLQLREDEAGGPLKPEFRTAFEYSDCWVNDARLVVLNARDAADRGAVIRTRTKVVAAERDGDMWIVMVEDTASGAREEVRARLVVNAAGPWVDAVLARALGRNDVHNVRLVKGSHIVIERKFRHERAYFFQNADGRIFFAIPYEGEFTLIGTTDEDYRGAPGDIDISDDEIDYLCEGASAYFAEPVSHDDIVWTYSGIRPLYDDGASKAQEATRDYVLKSDGGGGTAPLLNIFGGKITTYRRLAESMLALIEEHLGKRGDPWTRDTTLPGGDFPATGFSEQVRALSRDYPFLGGDQCERYTRLYGTKARTLLGSAANVDQLGRNFGSGLFEAEVRYLVEHEWARTADDVLWRRTKLGLTISREEKAALEEYLGQGLQAAEG